MIFQAFFVRIIQEIPLLKVRNVGFMNKFSSIEKLLIGYSVVAVPRTFGAP